MVITKQLLISPHYFVSETCCPLLILYVKLPLEFVVSLAQAILSFSLFEDIDRPHVAEQIRLTWANSSYRLVLDRNFKCCRFVQIGEAVDFNFSVCLRRDGLVFQE